MSYNRKAPRFLAAALAAAVLLTVGFSFAAGRSSGKTESAQPPESYAFSRTEIHSGRHTQYQEPAGTVQSPYTVEGYTLRLSSDKLQVWVQEKTSRLRIVDQRSGYVWGLCADEKPDGLNKAWHKMASSLCAIEYYDDSGSEKTASAESAGVKLRYDWGKENFRCDIDMTEQGIRFAVEVALDGESLHIKVVENTLEEYGECKIKSLYFMPFLGSTYADEINGYFFVPDGCGALIRFQKPTAYSSPLEGRVYGADPGIDALNTPASLLASRGNDYLVEESGMTLPVFGIVHGEGQNGVFAIVESGVEQAYIKASVAGVITDYNWLTARFAYRTSYMKPINKAGSGVYTAQETANDIDPASTYVFLTGEDANYSAMAVYYRDRLRAEGNLPQGTAQSEMPMWLSVLGAEVKEGILYNTTSVLTTVAQAQDITETLGADGIRNLHACYYGWERGGVNGSKYGELKLDGKLGSGKEALETWRESLAAAGGRLSLYRNLGEANEDQISERSQAAMNISSAYAHYHVDNDTLMYTDSYVVKGSAVTENLRELREMWPDYGLALDNIGSAPFSDYTRGAQTTRQQTMDAFSNMLAEGNPMGTAVFQPSLYQWSYVGDYLDIPMVSSQYLFETDTVPFLQMVLKGSLNYYSPYVNLGFYSDYSILKMVEYGTYPSFVVAHAQSHELEGTPLESLFSVNFEDWRENIDQVYERLSAALNRVEGRSISDHKMVASGVACVTYEGGVRIYVNYNNTAATVDGVNVPAMSYLVEEGG